MQLSEFQVFRVTDVWGARRLFAAGQALADARGFVLRAPPPEPVGCCGRGCNGCVWEGFFAATQHWKSDAVEALSATGPSQAQA